MSIGIAGFAIKYTVDRFATQNLDLSAELKSLGIRYSDLNSYGLRIPPDKEFKLWTLIAQKTKDPRFAIKEAAKLPFGSIPLFDYALASCGTLASAIELASRSSSLINNLWKSHLKVAPSDTILYFEADSAAKKNFWSIDYYLGCFPIRCMQIANSRPLAEVSLSRPDEGFKSLYEETFQCPVRFVPDSEISTLKFLPSIHTTKCVQADLEMYRRLMGHLAKVSMLFRTSFGQPDFVFELRKQVRHSVLGSREPNLPSMAKTIALSGRTLQRKLKRVGLTFEGLVREIRLDIAKELIQEGVALETVADRVGYSSGGSLLRAIQKFGNNQTSM